MLDSRDTILSCGQSPSGRPGCRCQREAALAGPPRQTPGGHSGELCSALVEQEVEVSVRCGVYLVKVTDGLVGVAMTLGANVRRCQTVTLTVHLLSETQAAHLKQQYRKVFQIIVMRRKKYKLKCSF